MLTDVLREEFERTIRSRVDEVIGIIESRPHLGALGLDYLVEHVRARGLEYARALVNGVAGLDSYGQEAAMIAMQGVIADRAEEWRASLQAPSELAP